MLGLMHVPNIVWNGFAAFIRYLQRHFCALAGSIDNDVNTHSAPIIRYRRPAYC